MEKRTIIITGAATGIGEATARLFAKEGYFVGLLDLNQEGVDKLQKELGDDTAMSHKCDITDTKSIQEAFDAFSKITDGRIDVVHANAGVIFTGNFKDQDVNKLKLMVNVNAFGTLNTVHTAIPYLKKMDKSNIVITSSASAVWGIPYFSIYAATKAFVRSFTESVRNELSVDNIVVNDVMPMFVKTAMMDDVGATSDDYEAKLTADDIAKVVLENVNNPEILHNPIGEKIGLLRFLSKIMSDRKFNKFMKKTFMDNINKK